MCEMKKRIVALLLLCVVSVSVLYGCSSGNFSEDQIYVYCEPMRIAACSGPPPLSSLRESPERETLAEFRINYPESTFWIEIFERYAVSPKLLFKRSDFEIREMYCIQTACEALICFVTDKGNFLYYSNTYGEEGLFPEEHFSGLMACARVAAKRLPEDYVGHTILPASEYFDFTPYSVNTLLTEDRLQDLLGNYSPPDFPEELLE